MQTRELKKYNDDATKNLLQLFGLDSIDATQKLNFSEIHAALINGADPNAIPHPAYESLSCLYVAINANLLPIVQLLLQYGADANYLGRHTANQLENRCTLLHKAIDAHQDCYRFFDNPPSKEVTFAILKLIEKHFIIPKEYQVNIATIYMLYEKLKKSIHNELKIAQSQNKHFLVIIGELHDSQFSLLIECLVLLILKELNISKLGIELSQSKYGTFVKNNYTFPDRDKQYISSDLIPFALELQFSIEPVDLDATDDEDKDTKPEGMDRRDEGMRSAIQTITEHSVLIVGYNHLYGLCFQQNYPDHHIVTINATVQKRDNIEKDIKKYDTESSKIKYVFGVVSPQVLQMNETNWEHTETFLYSEKTLELAKECHYGHQMTNSEKQVRSVSTNGFFNPKQQEEDISRLNKCSIRSSICNIL